ncbi:hypothetical protein ACFLWZ_08300 [Chloroflexota bacterium]
MTWGGFSFPQSRDYSRGYLLVIPIYNEDYNVMPLVMRVACALSRFDYEILFIDDNSIVATAGLTQCLSSKHPISSLVASGKGGGASLGSY